MDVDSRWTSTPLKLGRHCYCLPVDGARLSVSVDPDFQRSGIAIQLEVVQRLQQLQKRLWPLVGDDDDSDIHAVGVFTRMLWPARFDSVYRQRGCSVDVSGGCGRNEVIFIRRQVAQNVRGHVGRQVDKYEHRQRRGH